MGLVVLYDKKMPLQVELGGGGGGEAGVWEIEKGMIVVKMMMRLSMKLSAMIWVSLCSEFCRERETDREQFEEKGSLFVGF